jgi:hypothetical protein
MDEKKELVEFLKETGEEDLLTIEEDLGSGFYRLNVREAERRQAKHDIRSVEDALLEFLRNSRDAGAKHIFVATSKKGNEIREIVVLDDGEGIPSSLWEKIFEPRVTSRLFNLIEDDFGVHGRGMALYAVKVRSKESKVTFSEPGKGCSIKAYFDLRDLPERKDQSTKPKLIREKGELRVKGGVKNIWRTLLEFSLSYPHLKIYYGSPSEIAATIRKLSLSRELDNTFFSESSQWRTASEAKDALSHWGLIISERNAYRILSGEIEPLTPVSFILSPSQKDKKIHFHLDKSDLKEIKKKTQEAVEEIVQRYFLAVTDMSISQRGKRLNIVVSLEDKEEIG